MVNPKGHTTAPTFGWGVRGELAMPYKKDSRPPLGPLAGFPGAPCGLILILILIIILIIIFIIILIVILIL